METNKLYLTDEHQPAGIVGISIAIGRKINKATHRLQLLLVVGGDADLQKPRYRHMIGGLDDAVALVLGDDAHHGILHARLPNIL